MATWFPLTSRTLWRCANHYQMSPVAAAYVPQPAVIWLFREPKRWPTDQAVLQCRRQQAGTHYLNRSGQFQRRLNTSLFRLAYGSDLTAHSWLSRRLERRTINVQTELNLRCSVPRGSRQFHLVYFIYRPAYFTKLAGKSAACMSKI